jgi:IclR family transcriptional regulator, KDG regulon repressor
MKMEWLNRFTEVMDCISRNPNEGIGVSELSRNTNLSKGTIHRMLSSMIEHQLVNQNSQTKNYILGPKAMIWGSQFLRAQDPIGLIGRYCDEISAKTGLYSYLCKFQADQVYCIYTHQPSHLRSKYFVHVGQRMPLYCSAASKVILAYQEPDLIRLLLEKERITPFTPFTVTNMSDIENELKLVLVEDVAYCLQELEIGVSAISMPIFHEDKKTTMSLSLVGESTFMESEKEKILNELREVAIKASEHLKSMHLLTSIQF